MWAVDLKQRRCWTADRAARRPRSDVVVSARPDRLSRRCSYRGDSKTDAKDAAIIADQARMRRDLHPMRVDGEISVELKILTSRRTDLMRDRTRAINRLRALLTGYFPTLERSLDVRNSVGVDLVVPLSNARRTSETWSDEVGSVAAEEEGIQRLSAC